MSNLRRILLIRYKMIGDVLLTTVIAESLRRTFPDARIDYLTYDNSLSILENNPSIDHIYALTAEQRKSPLGYLHFIRKVVANDYDAVFDAASTAKSELVSLMARGARFRIGRKKPWRGFSYTHKIPRSELPKNKLAERLALLQPLIEAGYSVSQTKHFAIYLSDKEKLQMRGRLEQAGLNLSVPIVAVAHSAREQSKKWPRERIVKLIDYLLRQKQVQVVLVAGLPHEKHEAQEIFSQLGEPPNLFASIPNHNLRDLVVQLSYAQLFVGNEGGPRHFAAAVGTPTVAIVSPSADKSEWLPASSSEHLAIEWRDINAQAHPATGSVAARDPAYFDLYGLVSFDHVRALVDQQCEALGITSDTE